MLSVSGGLWQLDMYTWQAGQILVTESYPLVMPWDGEPLRYVLPTAMGLAGAQVLELLLASTKVVCFTLLAY